MEAPRILISQTSDLLFRVDVFSRCSNGNDLSMSLVGFVCSKFTESHRDSLKMKSEFLDVYHEISDLPDMLEAHKLERF